MSLAVTLLFSFGTWRGRGGETCKTGHRETTVRRREWAAQVGKVILQLQTQSISPWHPAGADGSQRRQPASLPLEASSHTALSVAPRVQGPAPHPRHLARSSHPGVRGPEPPWPSRWCQLTCGAFLHNRCRGSRRGGVAGCGRGGQVWGSCPAWLPDPRRASRRARGRGRRRCWGQPPLHPCPAAGLPQRTEPPPPRSTASFQRAHQPCRTSRFSGSKSPGRPRPALTCRGPSAGTKRVPQTLGPWPACRLPLQKQPWAAPHGPAVGRPAVPTQAGTLVSKPKSSRGERENAGV